MKSMTFDEFHAMPPGTIFGQVTGLPHQDSPGLCVKCDSVAGCDPGEDSDEEYESRGINYRHALLWDDGFDDEEWFLTADLLEDDHRFLVYGPEDIDRLVALLGRGPVAQDVGGPGGITMTWEAYNR